MTGMRDHTVDLGGRVRVVDYGGAGTHTFVCVHGLGGWALDWQLLAPRLTAHGRVLAVDLPGFGHSPLDGRSGSIDALQGLLQRFLKDHVGAPAVLVGNSMGGAIALLQAVRQPASVTRLVLVSPVLPASLRTRPHPLVTAQFVLYTLPWIGERFLQARRKRVDHRTLVDWSLAFLTASADRIPRSVYDERYALVQRLATTADGDRAFLAAARSLLRLIADPRRYRRIIAGVRVPTLVVHGAEDRLVPAQAARQLASLRADWLVHVLADVGHVAQLEAPREVGDIIAAWVQVPAEA